MNYNLEWCNSAAFLILASDFKLENGDAKFWYLKQRRSEGEMQASLVYEELVNRFPCT